MGEFRDAIAAFDAATRRAVQTCASVPAGLWVQKDRSGTSMSEVVEHMALSNGLFLQRLEKILASPGGSDPYAQLEDAEIPHLFGRVDEPPGIAEPTGTWSDRDDALRSLEASAAPLVALSNSAGDFRRRGARHPLFGPLDGVQWALFAEAHTERHRSELIGMHARLTPAQ
jgi:hypothetical protein